MQLSQTQKFFSDFFSAFLESSLNFENFLKKYALIAYVFSKLRTQEDLVRSMTRKSRFKGYFKKQRGKCTQRLFKFAWQNLYHI